jgi:predicted nucleic acid-binding protein
VKAFVDTNVLVSAFHTDLARHEASLTLLEKYPQTQICCSAHSMAELYSTLTRMPPPRRARPEEAMLFLADIKSRLTAIALTPEEYFAAISEYSAMGVVGGAIYDALIARCALKARAEKIFTWNIRHFRQFGPEVEKKLRTP